MKLTWAVVSIREQASRIITDIGNGEGSELRPYDGITNENNRGWERAARDRLRLRLAPLLLALDRVRPLVANLARRSSKFMITVCV